MNLRKLARGKPCQIRIPNVCNFNPETTVLCHLNGGGMGMKQPDLLGAWGCSSCHDVVDGRVQIIGHTPTQIKNMILEGVIRTQKELLAMGLEKEIDKWRE